MRKAILMCLLGVCACTSKTPAPPAKPTAPPPPIPVAESVLPLAFRAQLSDPPAARIDIYVTPAAVWVDEDPLWAALPEKKPDNWASRPPGPYALVKAGSKPGTFDPAGLAHLRETLTGLQTRSQVEDLQIIAHKDMRYDQVMTVLGIARAAGLKRWWVRARGRTRVQSFRVRRARWCAEAISAPTPCSITWALITDKLLYTQTRTHAEAACGIPPTPAPPKPAQIMSDARSTCRKLRHKGEQVAAAVIPPHIGRHTKGVRCAFGTVAAWPTARWTQVTEVADGLRAAGHETIALSLAAADEKCPEPPPAVAPASAPSSSK